MLIYLCLYTFFNNNMHVLYLKNRYFQFTAGRYINRISAQRFV